LIPRRWISTKPHSDEPEMETGEVEVAAGSTR
jgi:hypothetical protein